MNERSGLAVIEPGIEGGSSAVVADRMPLIRLGVATSLRLAGVVTVSHAEELTDGVDVARAGAASLLVLGSTAELDTVVLGRQIARVAPTRVIVLVAQADRASLVALLEAGAHGVALRTIGPEDLGGLVRSVLAGERSVGPALMSVLVDVVRGKDLSPGLAASRFSGVPVPTGAVLSTAGPSAPDVPPSQAQAASAAAAGLTTKELAVLARLAHGESNAEIARALYVSPATVKTHLTHIYGKLGVGSRHGAMSRAVALGVLH